MQVALSSAMGVSVSMNSLYLQYLTPISKFDGDGDGRIVENGDGAGMGTGGRKVLTPA